LDAEVIIVGAGPAGASAAYHLAKSGRKVLLLDRQIFPRDKSCGDGLTRSAVRTLTEMGVTQLLNGAVKIGGVRIFMRGRGTRDFNYPDGMGEPDHGMVVPRLQLDEAICRQAVAAGANFQQATSVTSLIRKGDVTVGVEIIHAGKKSELYAPVVVAADGATSRLARQANLVETLPETYGFAIRGYYSGVKNLTDLLEIYMPVMDFTDQFLLPSYGWVFPVGEAKANIGVGVFQRDSTETVRELFNRFLLELKRQDNRFEHAEPCSPWKGAPLRFDFAPEHCVGRGLALIGDAAGMISPFTGEGISYALESGKLVAEAIDRNLRPGLIGPPDLSDFAALLEKNFTGYFEIGRHSARRYLLIWHVLDSTFHNERPLFNLCRRAVLFPEGVGETPATGMLDDVAPLIPHAGLRVEEELLAVGGLLLDTVRYDWPFLAQVHKAADGDSGIPFRPALLLLLASHFGKSRESTLTTVGAAIELGYLAALSHLSVESNLEEPNQKERPANWGNMLAVMVGDFLLSKAYEISAQAGAEVSSLISQALSKACEGRMQEIRHCYNQELSDDEHLDILRRKTATLFELPCRLGAVLSHASALVADSLSRYGLHLGLSFQLADDALDLIGDASRLGKATGTDLREGVYSLPVLWALRQQNGEGEWLRERLRKARLSSEEEQEVVARVRESGGVEAAMTIARREAESAKLALNELPNGPARLSLSRLADFSISRKFLKDQVGNVN
jgi:geranylgeranyl reductase family protein